MPTRRSGIAIALGAVAAGAVIACTLNPQPLPPGDFAGPTSSNSSDASPDSRVSPENPPVPADAGANLDVDGAADGGTRQGDAGDAGDADGD